MAVSKGVWLGAGAVVIGLLAGVVWYLVQVKPISAAQEQVANSLLDPGSAQFRGVFRTNDQAVCGEVNGKNRMGGYVGFRWFMVERGTVLMDGADEELVMGLCARRKR